MNLLFIFLQATGISTPTAAPAPESQVIQENFFTLMMKGGWVLVPIILLLFLAVYVIIERWLVLKNAKNKDKMWISHVSELIAEQKMEKASKFCSDLNTSSSRVANAGVVEIDQDLEEIEEAIQIESRQEINRLELRMNYLGITAAIAPMLGFLGTIFGVIKIFYNIAKTNDLNIATISDGLYQKMICSGAGLLVGIVAYAGYYILNSRIDRIINQVEKDSNEILKSIRFFKKNR